MPTKGALSQIRKRIHSDYFKDIFNELVAEAKPHRKKWKGLYVYAIDGLQVTLPRTEDIIKADYNGRKVSRYRESYMPRMYLTHAFDVLSGVSRDLRENPTLNEVADAEDMVKGFEDNSLTIYDRLYVSRKLIHAHHSGQSYFLFRLRKSAIKELTSIYKIKHKNITATVDGIEVQVIKFYNKREKVWDAYVTNLPKKRAKEKTIKNLYRLRWEVETSFRDLTQTLQIEDWHSRFINGIRQELYVAFWLMNYVKLKILLKRDLGLKVEKNIYKKTNFKFILTWVLKQLPRIFQEVRRVIKYFGELIDRSIETRKRHSRSYPRELKNPASNYPRNNTKWNI